MWYRDRVGMTRPTILTEKITFAPFTAAWSNHWVFWDPGISPMSWVSFLCGKTKGNSRLNRWTQIQKISVSTVLLEPVGTIQKGHSDTCSDSSGRNPMASVISVTILVWETLIFSSIGQVVFSVTRTDFTLLKCKWYKQNMYKYKAAIICNLDVQLYT